jgi:precorrin-6A/cobalt-precorrin-6A reductase
LPARKRVLIVGGTVEARNLAEVLVRRGCPVITSLAGVTADAMKPAGTVRIGGFGGVEGLRDFLLRDGIDAVADASHPFAGLISAHICAATSELAIDLVRLERPAWQPQAGDQWTSVGSYQQAADTIAPGAVALLTVGRRELAPFLARADVSGVARSIGVPPSPLPANWLLLVARPPLRVASEMALLRRHSITVAVTKNAGGDATVAKLEAARALSIPVIVIERPQKPPARIVHTVEAAADFLGSHRA